MIEGEYSDAPDIAATWYVDPPYQTPAGAHYPHKFTDHAALGEWCQSRRGQVIACDQEGSTWLPWNHQISIGSTAGHKRTE